MTPRSLVVLALTAVLAGCGSTSAEKSDSVSLPQVGGAAHSSDPALAIHGGHIVLAWLAGDSSGWRIYSARSADRGRTWTTAVPVSSPGEPVHPHGESSPRLVAGSDGKIALIWATSEEVEGREWPASRIRFSRSVDGGATWSSAITLNDDSTAVPSGHTFQGASMVGDSGLVVAWLDERRPAIPGSADQEAAEDASLYSVRSDDFGAHWNRNILVSDRVCPCCRVELSGHGAEVFAAWRRHYPGQVRDIVMAQLESPPRRVHADDWRVSGCPHSGPALGVGPDGDVRIAWFTGAPGRSGVYCRIDDGHVDSTVAPIPVVVGANLPTAHVAILASSQVGTIVASDVDSTGERAIVLAGIDGSSPRVAWRQRVAESDAGIYPQIGLLTEPDEVLVAWTSTVAGKPSVRLARVRIPRPLGS